MPEHTIGSAPFRNDDEGNDAASLGDGIRPFLVGGSFCRHIFIPEDPLPFEYNSAPDGVQLITSVYVPQDNVGFVKGIRVAPHMPAYLAPNWQKTPGVQLVAGDEVNTNVVQAAGGWWSTPAGWQCFVDPNNEIAFPPYWRWHLTFVKGTLSENRKFPVSILDPETFRFVEGPPVPRIAYPTGIPGDRPGWDFGDQLVQRTDLTADGSLHITVPSNTTVCLWAEWRQAEYTVQIQRWNSLIAGLQQTFDGVSPIYVLLPSFGTLAGYIQPRQSTPAKENAQLGWGG